MEVFIKEVSKRHGVSLVELARRLGVTRQTLYYYCEQGDKNPVAQLEKIADAIGVPLSELLTDPDADPFDGGCIIIVIDGLGTHTFRSRQEYEEYADTLNADSQ